MSNRKSAEAIVGQPEGLNINNASRGDNSHDKFKRTSEQRPRGAAVTTQSGQNSAVSSTVKEGVASHGEVTLDES